jgi:hypothetical protein
MGWRARDPGSPKQPPEALGPAIRQQAPIGSPVGLWTLDLGDVRQDKRRLLRKEPFPHRTWIRPAQKAVDVLGSRVEGAPHPGDGARATEGADLQEGLADLGCLSRQGLSLK